MKSDVKDTESHDVDVTDNEDHETMSEIASDDGNSSVHSECLWLICQMNEEGGA